MSDLVRSSVATGALALAGVAVAIVALVPAVAASDQLGAAVPEEFRALLVQAAAACPGLPVEVLAAQLQVESGFDPAAVSRDGAEGIAQFLPASWASWGRDVNADGSASPFDPADAIDAQGRLMCDLLRRAEGSGLTGDPVQLALAGYDAGWGAVLQAGGIPPSVEVRDYVSRVTAEAAQLGPLLAGGSFGDSAGFGDLPRPNPNTVGDAIAYARAAVDGPPEWYRRCLNFVARAYGYSNAGTPYAIDHYRVVMPVSMRHDGDRNPPPGALMFWDTGSRAGHVALYLGGGVIASNDIVTPGAISIVPAAEIERRWGATYVGWSPPYFPTAG